MDKLYSTPVYFNNADSSAAQDEKAQHAPDSSWFLTGVTHPHYRESKRVGKAVTSIVLFVNSNLIPYPVIIKL